LQAGDAQIAPGPLTPPTRPIEPGNGTNFNVGAVGFSQNRSLIRGALVAAMARS
jgi:hypothetical protein